MKRKKVLITYATYGSGHKTVANYIYDYLIKHSDYEVKIIDLMDYENIVGLISKKAFDQNFKSKISSFIFSIVYTLFDNKPATIPYRQITNAIFKNKKLKEDIVEFNPDLLISTHFFGHIVLGMLNKKNLTHAKIISIITDYKSHEMWLKDEKSLDAIIVSNDIVKNDLIEQKIDSKKIYSYGIPIKENFSNITNIQEVKEKYKVNNNKKTFLFFAGGSAGSSFSYRYFKRLLEEEFDINIIYVCGKNENLKKKAEKLVKNYRYKNVHVLGFSNEVNNLLSISDIVITKPGGISITECLEVKKPMLLIPGNGGNEIYNANFVCKNGYGLNCLTSRRLVKNVNKVLKRKTILYSMNKKLEKYNNNKSVEKIYKLSKKILDKK